MTGQLRGDAERGEQLIWLRGVVSTGEKVSWGLQSHGVLLKDSITVSLFGLLAGISGGRHPQLGEAILEFWDGRLLKFGGVRRGGDLENIGGDSSLATSS